MWERLYTFKLPFPLLIHSTPPLFSSWGSPSTTLTPWVAHSLVTSSMLYSLVSSRSRPLSITVPSQMTGGRWNWRWGFYGLCKLFNYWYPLFCALQLWNYSRDLQLSNDMYVIQWMWYPVFILVDCNTLRQSFDSWLLNMGIQNISNHCSLCISHCADILCALYLFFEWQYLSRDICASPCVHSVWISFCCLSQRVHESKFSSAREAGEIVVPAGMGCCSSVSWP